jgi:O-acetyl-ADP-ribose deacetylase (regulator of RNase III)
MVVAGPGAAISVVALETGRSVATFEGGHTTDVLAVAVTPDDRLVVSASEGGTVRVWELDGGRLTRTIAPGVGPLWTLRLVDDGNIAIVGGREGALVVIDLTVGRIVRSIRAHDGGVNALAASPDGRMLASAAMDGTTRIWDLPSIGAARPAPIDRRLALAAIEMARGDLLERDEDALVYAVGLDPQNVGMIGNRLALLLNGPQRESVVQRPALRSREAHAIRMDSGALRAKYVIQTATEEERGHEEMHSRESITDAVASALEVAESLGDVRSVSLPSMGTGAAGFEPDALAPMILDAIVRHLERGSYLDRVTLVFNNEVHERAYSDALALLRASLTRDQVAAPTESATYTLQLTRLVDASAPAPAPVTVGDVIALRLELRRALAGEQGIALPSSAGEVHCFVTGDAGLRLEGAEAVALRLPSDGAVAAGEVRFRAHLVGERRYTVELYLEGSGSDSASVREYSDTVSVAAPVAAFRPEILPPLDLRVAARPDVVLEVTATTTNDSSRAHRLTYRISSRVAGAQFAAEVAGAAELGPVERSRIRSLVRDAVRTATTEQPEDCRARMVAIGSYLYDRLVPREGAGQLRDMIEQVEAARRNRIATPTKPERPLTWLVIESGTEASLPWELVVPYEANAPGARFLSESWHMSHWVAGLGPPLQSEVPVGDVALMYYGQSADETDDARRLHAWGRLLNASMASDIKQVAAPETPVYGLHLLRQAGATAVGIAPRGAGAATDEVRRARLDLRLKRPLVTLGVLDDRSSDETSPTDASTVADGNWPLVERALPYLRAGASAVAGTWWPTSAGADRVFWTTFYDLLIARQLSLGESVWRSRLAVARALPERSDWLAYVLFGNPLARPYVPADSEGYTTLQCLDADSPLRVGKEYIFSASIRTRPPLWHQDRLVRVQKDEDSEETPDTLSALFVAPGLQGAVPEPVPMRPVGRTIHEATCALTPKQPGEYLLTVRLLKGDERLQTLRLPLVVGNGRPTTVNGEATLVSAGESP